ncbi:hypothetical protein HDU96_000144, partial [Phlyctochytrium bullatum]
TQKNFGKSKPKDENMAVLVTTIALPSLFSKPPPPIHTTPSPSATSDSDAGLDLHLPRLHCLLVRNVPDAEDIKKRIIAGDPAIPNCVMVNAKMLLSLDQIAMAATRAFLAQNQGTLKTKTLLSEILFNLSPNNNIGEAMKLFGVGKSVTDVVVILIDPLPAQEALEGLLGVMRGSPADIRELQGLADVEFIRKTFKIPPSSTQWKSPTEGNLDWLLDVVISSMAIKGYT